MNKFEGKDIYKQYLEEGVNNLNTRELLELMDILYSLKKFHELIDVAEYTISLTDMGINNDFLDEDLEEWLNNNFEEEEIDEYELDFPEENIVNAEELEDELEEEDTEEEERKADNIDSLKEYLIKLIIECALKIGDYDKVYPAINKLMESFDIREADLYYDVALIGMNAKDYLFSIKYLKHIINDPIHKIAAINNLAICYEALGENRKGIKLLQDHLDEDPYDNISWINLGTLLAKNEEFDEALKAFDISFAIDDTNLSCLKNIAKIYKFKNNFNKALKYLDDAEKLDPNDYEILIIKAECYMLMNKPKKAIKLFKTVLEEFYDRAEIHHSLSVAYILDGQVEKGYRSAIKAWELAPDNHFFKSFVAKILGEDKGLKTQADKLYRELLRDSKDPNIHMIAAQYYLNNNNPNKALQIALKVKENYQDVKHLHIFLARCYAILGKFDDAQIEFEQEPDEIAKQEFYNILNNAKSN